MTEQISSNAVPAWAVELSQRFDRMAEADRQAKEFQAQQEAQRNAPKPKQYISTPFGMVEDTPLNRQMTANSRLEADAIGSQFDLFNMLETNMPEVAAKAYADIAEYKMKNDPLREPTQEEIDAKEAAKQRAIMAMGSRLSPVSAEDKFFK